MALHRLSCSVALDRGENVRRLVSRVVDVDRSDYVVVVACRGVKTTASEAVDEAGTVGGLGEQGTEG